MQSAFQREIRLRALLTKQQRRTDPKTEYVPLYNRTNDPKICVACQKEWRHMQKCGGCKTVYYCTRRCQRTDWKHHKDECDPDFCLPLGTSGIVYNGNWVNDTRDWFCNICCAPFIPSTGRVCHCPGCARSQCFDTFGIDQTATNKLLRSLVLENTKTQQEALTDAITESPLRLGERLSRKRLP